MKAFGRQYIPCNVKTTSQTSTDLDVGAMLIVYDGRLVDVKQLSKVNGLLYKTIDGHLSNFRRLIHEYCEIFFCMAKQTNFTD